LEDWGREGDCGVIAEGGGRFLGAAWYRCWTDERHSYGFVAPEVPEMGIGLHHGWRGQGVGGALIAALCRCAVEAGVAGLSLSVEVDNPARRLYLRHGFADHGQVEGAVTMMKDLSPDPDEGPGRGEELPWSLTLSPC
jgi:GNAT superfamily N-acetyltransferase